MQIRHNITLDEDISLELDSIANELGEKKSSVIEKALAVYFDFLDLKLVQKRMKDLKEGRDTIIDAKEVWKEIGV
ncbi:MAG: CopG family transcriptional regulator [Proteobacteria bacterium]|nr:CopG family transcriptional regulator [Pseudomonadota bacterium]